MKKAIYTAGLTAMLSGCAATSGLETRVSTPKTSVSDPMTQVIVYQDRAPQQKPAQTEQDDSKSYVTIEDCSYRITMLEWMDMARNHEYKPDDSKKDCAHKQLARAARWFLRLPDTVVTNNYCGEPGTYDLATCDPTEQIFVEREYDPNAVIAQAMKDPEFQKKVEAADNAPWGLSLDVHEATKARRNMGSGYIFMMEDEDVK